MTIEKYYLIANNFNTVATPLGFPGNVYNLKAVIQQFKNLRVQSATNQQILNLRGQIVNARDQIIKLFSETRKELIRNGNYESFYNSFLDDNAIKILENIILILILIVI